MLASTRNWRRMTRGVAPSALRRPISRIRSVTETSMMFMTPMPPTSSEMPAMLARSTVRMWAVLVAVCTSDCWLLTVKSWDASVTPWLVSRALVASWYAAERPSWSRASR